MQNEILVSICPFFELILFVCFVVNKNLRVATIVCLVVE